ncbi:MAG: hypothetical protein FWB85_01915 [Chitinispirillia bacterium]|nr:hypothetical protein [Chitinispirillia bacterium]MCL2241148.1 hypothetical protein [Chitinispirillia bacterium]
MDLAAILIKITGLLLFAFTARSVYKHIKAKFVKKPAPAAQPAAPAENKQEHSKVEQALNGLLLYAWFVFMIALSLGMVFNN